MDIYQILGLLIVVILIVWWALRRSTAQSEKEAPKGGHGESEPVEVDQAPVRAETVLVEPEPEPVIAAVVSEPEPEPEPEPAPIPEPVRTAEVKADDLVIIEGIGPRISEILINAGINTFAQLAEMKPEQIKDLLMGVDERLGRIADPSSWPQQASLAAKGEMEALQVLQDSLKAGRTG